MELAPRPCRLFTPFARISRIQQRSKTHLLASKQQRERTGKRKLFMIMNDDDQAFMDALDAPSALDAVEGEDNRERNLAMRWIRHDMGKSFCSPPLMVRLCVHFADWQVQRVVALAFAMEPALETDDLVAAALFPRLLSEMLDGAHTLWYEVFKKFTKYRLTSFAPYVFPRIDDMGPPVQSAVLEKIVEAAPELLAAECAPFIERVLALPLPETEPRFYMHRSPEVNIQASAARVLGPSWPSERVVSDLLAQLGKDNVYVQSAALQALGSHPITLAASSAALQNRLAELARDTDDDEVEEDDTSDNTMKSKMRAGALDIQDRLACACAFLLGSHARVGASSPVRVLPPSLLRLIAGML